MKEIWLTTTCLGPVEYYRVLTGADVAHIEACEHYVKQSWRNRYRILSANGPLDLSIPVVRGSSGGQLVREVRIDYRENWQKIHFRSIESAYRHSPYYEYFIDEFRPLWEERHEYLFGYNLEAMRVVLRLMKNPVRLVETSEYEHPGQYGSSDYRYYFHPKEKKEGTGLEPVPYHQVFSDRFGFVAGLSIVDWLFNAFRI